MKRATVIRTGAVLAAVVVLVLAVLGASALPVQQPSPNAAPTDDRARVAVVCPAVTAESDPTVVTAGSPQRRLTTAPLDDPEQTTDVSGVLGSISGVTAPMIVSAPRLDVFSATTRTAVESGSDRGLSLASCDRPGSSAWFTGVLSSSTSTAELVLFNADTSDASVDLTVYGAAGRLTAPGSRGIIVPARTRRVVPLGPLFTTDDTVSVQLATSAGRVAAMVRQRVRQNDKPAGSDWLPPTAEPANDLVIPGLASGKGARDLVVVNPGERTAAVALQVLGADGPIALPGFETIDLPPQTSRRIPLGKALAAAAVGLRLSSEQKITAGVLSDNGGDAKATDLAVQVATPVLTGPGVLALSPGRRLAPTLQLASGVPEASRVRVVVTSPSGKRLFNRTVTVPGLADIAVQLPKATDVLITVQPERPGALHASVGVRSRIGDVDGIASAAVFSGTPPSNLPTIRQDPRLGS